MGHNGGHNLGMHTPKIGGSRAPEPIYPWTRKKRGQWQACPTIEGRRCYGPQRDTRKEAYEDALMMIARAEGQQGDEIELFPATQRWLDYHRQESKQGTVAFYAEKIEGLVLYIGMKTPLWQITGRDCERFLEFRRSEAERSVKHFRRAMNAFFVWCVGQGLIKDNPMKQIPAARLRTLSKARQERFSWLPEEIVLQVCEAVEQSKGYWREPQFTADVIRLLYLTGLRRSEACRLTAKNVDFSRELIYVQGKREGVHDSMDLIPITDETKPILERLIQRAKQRGKPELFFARPDSMNGLFARVRVYITELVDVREARENGRKVKPPEVKKGGTPKLRAEVELDIEREQIKDLAPHALRHSLGTNLIRRGVPFADVQLILRHKTPGMTSRYVHASSPDLRRSAGRVSLLRVPESTSGGAVDA